MVLVAMKVKEITTKNAVTCTPDTTLAGAAHL
jgi:CBS domain-containing protein